MHIFFAKAYAANGGNCAAAARKVGITEMQGQRLLEKPEVRACVRDSVDQAVTAAQLDLTWVLQRLADEAVNPLNQGGERVRATELVGKYLKMFERDEKVTINLQFPEKTEKEIRSIINDPGADPFLEREVRAIEVTQRDIPSSECMPEVGGGSQGLDDQESED